MDIIPIVLQHGGYWDENSSYVNFKVCGLLIPMNCEYNNLVGMICNELKIQPETTLLKIEYQVKDGYPPFNIVDDLQLKFYIQLKKSELLDLTVYPLCLSIAKENIEARSVAICSEMTTDYLCLRSTHVEDVSSNSSDNNLEEAEEDGVVHYMDYAELVSTQMVDMSNEVTPEDKVMEFNKDVVISNKRNKNISVSQIYKDKVTMQSVLSHYAIKNNFQFKVQKSCKKEYLVGCVDNNCKWTLRASRNGRTNQFIIRRFVDAHTCALDIRFKSQHQATTSIIADVIKHKFTNIKTSYSVEDIIRDMKHDFNVEVNYNKAWRSKEKALEIMRGNASESYVELYPYLYMMYSTNPGSIIELKLDENRCFLYVFVALNASIKGWTHCIPVVVVDGTFLKSVHGGTLLVAATQDAGGKIFPLAFCVVDSENDESWQWFFEKFRQAYGIREDMTIVSDRHESIFKAASKVYPEVPHGVCIFHLLSNIKSNFKKNARKIKDVFFSAANAYTVKKIEYHMKELDKVDSRVVPYLQEIGYAKWAKTYSLNNRYSNMTSNVAESLNSVTMSIRELPICAMLECLRGLIQKWGWRNRNSANATSTRLTDKFEKILKKNFLYSVNLTVNPTNHILFEVHKVQNCEKKYVVDLSRRTCTCNRFQMDQIPCGHAIAVFQKSNLDPYDYCSPYYKKEAMIAAYKDIVYPVGNKDCWEIPENVRSVIVHPPKGRIKAGRPKKRRCKAIWERNEKPIKEIKCGNCGQIGHNKRTCRNPRKNN